MTKEQYQQQLRDCFRNDFVSAKHFIQVVLEPLFNEITYLSEEDMLLLSDYADYKLHGLQSVHKVAQITDAFNPIEVYDIVLSEKVNIAVARVYIQQFVRSMAIPSAHAFILFHYADSFNQDWRFSYLYKEDTLSSITNAKRYTYLFGKDHTCRTAEERFIELYGKKIEKQDMLEAFSVEALTKEFFTTYEAIYKKFCKHIEEHPEQFGEAFYQDATGKTLRDYVKKLLGRITFLCFLQKKRWLNGNIHFVHDLFFKATPAQQANFLDEVLEPLFFNCLNFPRPNDIFDTGVAAVGQVRIPYLNGGLFEREAIDEAPSCFPSELFQELLEFFEQYNFTIDENDPNDAEVGVDPEMLGKIFESLLEDNKDKGAYYTPKEIVQYMCRESLIAYLTNYIKENKSDIYREKQTEEAVRRLVQTPEQIVPKMIERQKLDFGKALRDVKICDPAIGSGAFPMGLLNELVRLRVSIGAWADKSNDIAALKREIIQNNIYGVDIEQGAIDIARLRFWLSIVVDANEPSPLPNFDYKFMRGNSLITTFGGEYINLDTKVQKHDRRDKMEEEKHVLYDLKKQYYTASGEQKLTLSAKIKKSILQLIALQLGYESRSWVASHAEQLSMFGDAKQLPFADVRQQLPQEKQRVINLCEQLHKQLEDKSLSLEKRAHTDIQFFDWRMMFTEIFDCDNPGFNIVIGNPPFVEFKTLDTAQKQLLDCYQTTKGKYDLYIPFIEKGLHLCTKHGTLTYICPTRFMKRDYGTALREHIKENCTLQQIVDFADHQVFDSAITYTGIFQFNNYPPNDTYSIKVLDPGAFPNRSITEFSSSNLNDSVWLFNDVKVATLLNKMSQHGQTLQSLCIGIYQGIASGKDEVFFISQETIDEYSIEVDLLHKVLKGRDIGPYAINWSGKFVIYPYNSKGKVIPEDEIIAKYPKLYNYLLSQRDNLRGRGYFDKSSKLWYELWNQRNLERFSQPKLMTLDNASKNSFTYDEEGLLGTTTVYSIVPNEVSECKYILGVLNSKCLNYYHKNKSIPQQGGFYRYQALFIQDLPIPSATPTQQQPIIKLVDAILAAKRQDPQADTSILENEIDILVYLLYQLTFDEVLLIDPKIEENNIISREEYEKRLAQ